jgi:hypothetical protein
MTTSITYSIANHYYMHYLQRNRQLIGNPSKTLKTVDFILKTENLLTTSSSQIQQVIPFSLFHCVSNAPQTKKRQALSLQLTYRNKIETTYQVMIDIARNVYPYPPIPQCSNAPSPYRRIFSNALLIFASSDASGTGMGERGNPDALPWRRIAAFTRAGRFDPDMASQSSNNRQ